MAEKMFEGAAVGTIFRTCFPAVSSLSLEAISSSRPFAMPTARCFWGGLIALVAMTARSPGQFPPLPDFKIGDFATNEIVTPVELIVTDPERTEQLRQQQAQGVPPIFFFHATAIDEVESNLRFTFTRAREKFQDALEGAYQRRKLNPQTMASPRFQQFVAAFQNQQRTFPLSGRLAAAWAQGEPDEAVQSEWVAKLRAAMDRHIRADTLPPAAKSGQEQVRMFSVKQTEASLDLSVVEKKSALMSFAEMPTLSQARADLKRRFSGEEQGVANFLAGLLKENCQFDERLTRQSRARATQSIQAADRYQAGQVIVKIGDRIDARSKAALDQLKARNAEPQPETSPGLESPSVVQLMAGARDWLETTWARMRVPGRNDPWVWAGVSVAGLLILWRGLRKRPHRALPLAHSSNQPGAYTVILSPSRNQTVFMPVDTAVAASAGNGQTAHPALLLGQAWPQTTNVEQWRRQMDETEQRIMKALAIVRAGLAPHLAHLLTNELVQELLSQRAHLLNTQQVAELVVTQLELRFARIQNQSEERLQLYEQRIADLEKELAARSEENRELIKASIALTQKQLEAERAKAGSAWN